MEQSFKSIIIISLLASAVVFLSGVKSDLSLGDETFHYRMARQIYDTGERPMYDPLFDAYDNTHLPYVNAPLWHYGLAYLWKLMGGPSPKTAQLYQSFYYFFLIIITSLIALEIYGIREAFYSALIIATVPLTVSLSIILHIDIPIAVFSALCFLLLIQKRFFWAGLAMGAMLLTKRNAYFLILPYAFLVAYLAESRFAAKIKALLMFASISIVINLPDITFRIKNYSFDFLYRFESLSPSPEYVSKDIPIFFYDQANIVEQPLNIVKYLGIVMLFSIGLYILNKKYSKKDSFLLISIFAYLILFLYFFRHGLIIRYLSPILPMLAVISSLGIASLKTKWLRNALIIMLFVQFVGSTYYVYEKRIIPQDIKDGYEFVNRNTPDSAHIMSTKNRLAYYTNRHVLWNSYLSLMEMPYLFWKADEKEAIDILSIYDIDYIFMEKGRIYDDSRVRHFGGYPKTFVQKISTFRHFKPVFENKDVIIWRIDK